MFLIFRSWQIEDEEAKNESLLLSCCLLPTNHISTLIYLVKFFEEVASHSATNKMDVSNLAIVLTPTFFPLNNNGDANPNQLNPSKNKSGDNLAQKTDIVKALFKNSSKVRKQNLIFEENF